MSTFRFTFSAEEVETLKQALEEAQHYRFDFEADEPGSCGDCLHLRNETKDMEAICDDHTSDMQQAAGFARLATIVDYQIREMN